MKSDIDIAKESKMKNIYDIAKDIGMDEEILIPYGKYKAKIDFSEIKQQKKSKLVLVTAINPTPAGEGKTTTTIGLGQALNKLNYKTIIALREPSLGPVMGIKGGAAGGGYSQVVPMEDINLHFTGDIPAITAANNAISAMIDNHIYQGNELNINPDKITWKRCMDMNDRALRNVTVYLSGKRKGESRRDGFTITAASEIMAILCLSTDISDLKENIGNIMIGYSFDDEPIYIKQLKISGAIAMLLKDAIQPNLVQTLENTPAIIHGGPFANIAHGCSSLIGTKVAMNYSDYVITEAGFGSDLGAEKFFNIKCRRGDLKPDCVVLVATIRALKYNGEGNLEKGFVNLEKHIENIKKFNLPVVVAINSFDSDTKEEQELLKRLLKDTLYSFSTVFRDGGDGGIDLAKKVVQLAENDNKFKYLYDVNSSIVDKINTIAKEVYGAKDVAFSDKAINAIKKIEDIKGDKLPICMAKTQYSFSDNPKLLGRPEGFTLNVRNVVLKSGAGFIVVLTGNVMTMPGLPKIPAAINMDIDDEGDITGLF